MLRGRQLLHQRSKDHLLNVEFWWIILLMFQKSQTRMYNSLCRLVNDGINKQPQLVNAGFVNHESTVAGPSMKGMAPLRTSTKIPGFAGPSTSGSVPEMQKRIAWTWGAWIDWGKGFQCSFWEVQHDKVFWKPDYSSGEVKCHNVMGTFSRAMKTPKTPSWVVPSSIFKHGLLLQVLSNLTSQPEFQDTRGTSRPEFLGPWQSYFCIPVYLRCPFGMFIMQPTLGKQTRLSGFRLKFILNTQQLCVEHRWLSLFKLQPSKSNASIPKMALVWDCVWIDSASNLDW